MIRQIEQAGGSTDSKGEEGVGGWQGVGGWRGRESLADAATQIVRFHFKQFLHSCVRRELWYHQRCGDLPGVQGQEVLIWAHGRTHRLLCSHDSHHEKISILITS